MRSLRDFSRPNSRQIASIGEQGGALRKLGTERGSIPQTIRTTARQGLYGGRGGGFWAFRADGAGRGVSGAVRRLEYRKICGSGRKAQYCTCSRRETPTPGGQYRKLYAETLLVSRQGSIPQFLCTGAQAQFLRYCHIILSSHLCPHPGLAHSARIMHQQSGAAVALSLDARQDTAHCRE